CRRVDAAYKGGHIDADVRYKLQQEVMHFLSDAIPDLLDTAVAGEGCRESFDRVHHDICEGILNIYDSVGGQTYGIAQRWLNTTLLNLVVIEYNIQTGYWPVAETRKYFHVPVDDTIMRVAATKKEGQFRNGLCLECVPLEHEPGTDYELGWYARGKTQRFEYWEYPEYIAFQTAVRDKILSLQNSSDDSYTDLLDWAFKVSLAK
ncbi:MAG: hypothetical protein LUC41_07210, partial [Clostridiales bacterium]|nr:hypothetical protein [Clostridiales bacterium]